MKINTITGTIPFTDRAININLDGKNLIVTGKNGCGKTQFFKSLSTILLKANNYGKNQEYYNGHIANSYKTISEYEKEIGHIESNIASIKTRLSQAKMQPNADDPFELSNLDTEYKQQQQLTNYTRALDEAKKQLFSYQQEALVFRSDIKDTQAQTTLEYADIDTPAPLFLFFEAQRNAKVQEVKNISSMSSERQSIQQQSKLKNRRGSSHTAGSFIEKYLANWEVKAALSFRKGETETGDELEQWKSNLTNSLRVLLDDDTTTLEFDENSYTYHIKQAHKQPFTFRDLSSGYASILQVFTDILMEIEVSEFTPETIVGFVIIDEIDAHLHTSLQKKVLPFFTQLFPNIQFIVSTHSPFVITSDDNLVIYDLSSLEQISSDETDLRLYGAEVLMESFLNVSAQSDWLTSKLNELTTTTEISELKQLVNEISPSESILDSEAKTYFYQAKRKLQQAGEK